MKKTNGSIGGCYRKIRLIDIKSVSLFDFSADRSVLIEMAGNPCELLCAPHSVSYEEGPAFDARQGGYMKVSVTGQLPRVEQLHSADLSILTGKRWIVLVETLMGAGNTKVLGTPDNPLRFSYRPAVSADHKTNAYAITIEGKTVQEGFYLSALNILS